MNKKTVLPTYHCLRCGHKWHPRKNVKPLVCGKCKSPYYDRPKLKKDKTNSENEMGNDNGLHADE